MVSISVIEMMMDSVEHEKKGEYVCYLNFYQLLVKLDGVMIALCKSDSV